MKNEIKNWILVAIAAIGLCGCGTTGGEKVFTGYVRETSFRLAGLKAGSEAIEHSPGNAEVVAFVAEAVDSVLEKESILFDAVEEWYKKEREKLKMDPLERELLEQLVIVPLWQGLKEKYGGNVLDITNAQVRSDLLAFKDGLELALY